MDIAKIRKKAKDLDAAPKLQPSGTELSAGPEKDATPPVQPEAEERKSTTEPEEEAGDVEIEFLTFSLAKEEYAFKIQEIQEIIKPQGITRIPGSEHYLLGITSLRGKVIPVIDLKKRLSLGGEGEEKRKQKILILKGPRGPIGALIDRVVGVVRSEASKIEETPPHLLETEMRFVEGVVLVNGRFIAIVKTAEAGDI